MIKEKLKEKVKKTLKTALEREKNNLEEYLQQTRQNIEYYKTLPPEKIIQTPASASLGTPAKEWLQYYENKAREIKEKIKIIEEAINKLNFLI